MSSPSLVAQAVTMAPRWALQTAEGVALPRRLTEVLEGVQAHGSLQAACRQLGVSYRHAWGWVRETERLLQAALVIGVRGRGSCLTPLAQELVQADRRAQRHAAEALGGRAPPLAPLLGRRSVSPRRLGGPGPTVEQIELMLQVALRAPDHGGLSPWRALVFGDAQREALADCFEQEKRRRDPLALPEDLRRAREHATRPPGLLAFVVAPEMRSSVPLREQWLAAGAALGNLLNAAHQLGFGAIVLSGERCFDRPLLDQLGVGRDEFLAGFVSLGRVVQAPPPLRPVAPGSKFSHWVPTPATVGASGGDA